MGGDASTLHAFRLTDSGRAVFGAPEVAPPSEPAERRCLVIQPNFDVVAYLEQADARTAGILGRIAESDSAHSGPIQTFRLTQASVYQAEESGLSHTQIVDFLRRHGQPEPPANVLARSRIGRGSARACRSALGSRSSASPRRKSAMRISRAIAARPVAIDS